MALVWARQDKGRRSARFRAGCRIATVRVRRTSRSTTIGRSQSARQFTSAKHVHPGSGRHESKLSFWSKRTADPVYHQKHAACSSSSKCELFSVAEPNHRSAGAGHNSCLPSALWRKDSGEYFRKSSPRTVVTRWKDGTHQLGDEVGDHLSLLRAQRERSREDVSLEAADGDAATETGLVDFNNRRKVTAGPRREVGDEDVRVGKGRLVVGDRGTGGEEGGRLHHEVRVSLGALQGWQGGAEADRESEVLIRRLGVWDARGL